MKITGSGRFKTNKKLTELRTGPGSFNAKYNCFCMKGTAQHSEIFGKDGRESRESHKSPIENGFTVAVVEKRLASYPLPFSPPHLHSPGKKNTEKGGCTAGRLGMF